MPVIPAPGRWRKEAPNFKIMFIYVVSERPALRYMRPYLKIILTVIMIIIFLN